MIAASNAGSEHRGWLKLRNTANSLELQFAPGQSTSGAFFEQS
jgi:hypothetical protein